MLTFKNFIEQTILEGGNSTAKWNTTRASKADIEKAIKFVSKHSKIPEEYLRDNLLGSTETTLLGLKKDSGDADIAIQSTEFDIDEIFAKLEKATGGEGILMKGISVASFAIPVGGDKKIQVDLMFVPDKKWAKFHYHSAEGRGSKYKGKIRTLLLMNTAKFKVDEGEDLILTDEKGNPIIRVGKSWKPIKGLERVFKIAPMAKSGKGRVKAMVDATPEEVKKELAKIDPKLKNAKFSSISELISDPDKAVEKLFGKGVGQKDVESAEQVVKLIKKFPKDIQEKIFSGVAKDVMPNDLLPPEIEKYRKP